MFDVVKKDRRSVSGIFSMFSRSVVGEVAFVVSKFPSSEVGGFFSIAKCIAPAGSCTFCGRG